MKLAAMILAAGQARRFGGRKQLAHIDGQAIVQRSAGQLSALLPDDTYVVTGAYHDEVSPLMHDRYRVLQHENWPLGLGNSVAFGVKEIMKKDEYDGILIALADQVAVRTEDFHRLIRQFDSQTIVAAFYKNRHAVPAIFPAFYFDQLCLLTVIVGRKAF